MWVTPYFGNPDQALALTGCLQCWREVPDGGTWCNYHPRPSSQNRDGRPQTTVSHLLWTWFRVCLAPPPQAEAPGPSGAWLWWAGVLDEGVGLFCLSGVARPGSGPCSGLGPTAAGGLALVAGLAPPGSDVQARGPKLSANQKTLLRLGTVPSCPPTLHHKHWEFYELGRPSNLIAPRTICCHKIRLSAMTWDWPDRPCHAEGPTRAEATSSHNLSQARLHDLGQPRNCDFWAGPQLPPNPSRLGMVQKRTRIGSFTS